MTEESTCQAPAAERLKFCQTLLSRTQSLESDGIGQSQCVHITLQPSQLPYTLRVLNTHAPRQNKLCIYFELKTDTQSDPVFLKHTETDL